MESQQNAKVVLRFELSINVLFSIEYFSLSRGSDMHSLACYLTAFALFVLCAKFSSPATYNSQRNGFFFQPPQENQESHDQTSWL